jgi:hypothetical protein
MQSLRWAPRSARRPWKPETLPVPRLRRAIFEGNQTPRQGQKMTEYDEEQADRWIRERNEERDPCAGCHEESTQGCTRCIYIDLLEEPKYENEHERDE